MPGDVVPEPQICRRIDLMEFLAFEEGAVVLEPERHDSADSDAHACPRLEFPLVLGTGEIALQRGVASSWTGPRRRSRVGVSSRVRALSLNAGRAVSYSALNPRLTGSRQDSGARMRERSRQPA